MLSQLLTAELFSLALVFCRIGSAIMLLPGYGERFILERFKLLLALAITFLVAPVVAPQLPTIPPAPFDLLVMMGGEILLGLFIGLISRIAMASLEILGTLISFHIGLSSAVVFNPSLSEQGSLTGVMLVMIALVVMFNTDAHHMTLMAAIDSYNLFQPGNWFPAGDFTQVVVRSVSASFRVGLQLSGPFIILAMVLNVAMALIARLMPQLQVYFLLLPVQLVLGLLMIAITLPTIMIVFFNFYSDTVNGAMLRR